MRIQAPRSHLVGTWFPFCGEASLHGEFICALGPIASLHGLTNNVD